MLSQQEKVCFHFCHLETWKPQSIDVIVEVRGGGISIAAAAKSFGIPKSRLHDGKSSLDVRIGRPCVLTPKEESVILNWVIDIAKAGFPV